MPQDYLERILTARVYDVAIESPLDAARSLSRRIGNTVWLKREDQQPVFSFKLRGAYNKMAHLSAEALAKGVICASAGNHAQGVALSARKLGCRAVIVMPVTTPRLKIDAVGALGGEVLLHGDSYSDAYAHALAVQQAHADSVRAARFAKLQSTVYLLMAGAELDAKGSLVMPAALAEPRLTLPASRTLSRLSASTRRSLNISSAAFWKWAIRKIMKCGWRNCTCETLIDPRSNTGVSPISTRVPPPWRPSSRSTSTIAATVGVASSTRPKPASRAACVPVFMATPTSACASAGASLMPSPAIATTLPSR